MATARSAASRKTWGDLWRLLLKCFTPNRLHSPSKVHIVFDNYTDNQMFSVKQTKRVSRAAGEGKRLHIGNDSQEMPEGDDYKYFLKNNLNKADLIRRFNEFVKREAPQLQLDYPLVITLEKVASEISVTGVQNLSSCNHEEADTRIMYHCILEDKQTVVIASDTDILILTVHVLASRLPDQNWFLQTKKNQFVNVSKIHDYVGNAVAITLPAMFVLTGSDTVSYFYRKSKKAVLERVLKQEVLAVDLLSDLGEHTHLSEMSEEKLKRFVQIFVYGMYVLMHVLIFYL